MGTPGIFSFIFYVFNYEIYILNMDFSISAASFFVYLFNYDSLINTLSNRTKTRAILPSFSGVT